LTWEIHINVDEPMLAVESAADDTVVPGLTPVYEVPETVAAVVKVVIALVTGVTTHVSSVLSANCNVALELVRIPPETV
jgi:hypothetical protein